MMLQHLCLILAMIGVLSASPADAAANTSCDVTVLPSVARAVLRRQLPEWRIVGPSDLSSDDKTLWSENYSGKCPGVIEGNFGSQGSFAITLTRKENVLKQTLVVLEKAGNDYIFHTLSPATETDVPNIILKFPPGTYEDAERNRKVRIRLDGVAYIKLEAAGTLYYPVGRHFESIEISE
jgi:hypothetical protein